MNMETTKHQNELMQHTCGLSNGENRNFFGTGKGKDADEFDKLVEAGLAERANAPSWSGDEFVYRLTDEGKKVAAETMPKPEPQKKLTRSQQNYQDYLHADCSGTFAEYIGFS